MLFIFNVISFAFIRDFLINNGTIYYPLTCTFEWFNFFGESFSFTLKLFFWLWFSLPTKHKKRIQVFDASTPLNAKNTSEKLLLFCKSLQFQLSAQYVWCFLNSQRFLPSFSDDIERSRNQILICTTIAFEATWTAFLVLQKFQSC